MARVLSPTRRNNQLWVRAVRAQLSYISAQISNLLRRAPRGILFTIFAGKHLFHPLSVDLESRPPLVSEIQHGLGFFALNFFFNLDIPRRFQLAHVGGEITPRKSSVLDQEDEIRTFNNIEVRHDQEPGRFVDQLVNSVKWPLLSTVVLIGCH